MTSLCPHCCSPKCVFEATTRNQRNECMDELLPSIAEKYYFYFRPTPAYLPKLIDQLPTDVKNDNGVLVVEQIGRVNAQAFLDKWISFEVRRTDAITDSLPYAQRLTWILHYENTSPEFKADYIRQMAIRRWPNDHFDEEFTAASGYHLDVPR